MYIVSLAANVPILISCIAHNEIVHVHIRVDTTIAQVTVFSDPMVSVLSALTDSNNAKYHGTSTFTKGQYIPIGG